MTGLEAADGDGQIGKDAAVPRAGIAVQAAVDIHGDHIGGAFIDGPDDFPGGPGDVSVKAGAEDAVHHRARVPEGLRLPRVRPEAVFHPRFPGEAEIIVPVRRKFFLQQKQAAGNARLFHKPGQDVAVPGVVPGAADDDDGGLPGHRPENRLPGPEHQLPPGGFLRDGFRVAFPHVLHG